MRDVDEAAHAALEALYGKEELEEMDGAKLTDLFSQMQWMLTAHVLYEAKDKDYGRAWARTGWQAQILQLYRRVCRLMVMGWWRYDPDTFNPTTANGNILDIVNHAYFASRLIQEGNVKGYE